MQTKDIMEKRAALLVIDVQAGLFRKSTPIYQANTLLENINSLVDTAHRSGIPVFYIQHSDSRALLSGSAEWQLHPQLHPQGTDFSIHKQHGNAFEETDLDELLRARNITTLFVTGLVTHGCVKATCIGALQLGYKVVLVSDAHSNYSKEAANLIDKWNQVLANSDVVLAPTFEVDFNQPEFN